METIRGLTRDEAREVDRRAIEEYGIPSILLMENAGRASANQVQALCGAHRREERAGEGPVLVLCGPGNNGGDGLVIARTLCNRDMAVDIVFVGEPDQLARSSDDVRTNLALWKGLGRDVEFVRTPDEVAALAGRMGDAAALVDALFGTGLARALRDPYAAVIGAMEASGRPVLAVDLPSGLDADTGEVLGVAVRADVTVTFVGPKRGFFRAQGPAHCGRVVVAEIGIPRAFLPR